MNALNRRRFLTGVGATLSAGLVAGCLADDDASDGWADVDEIRLEATADHWIGIEPEQIAGEQNPTIELVDGQDYTITWENGDGVRHNIAILDGDSQVVGDYQTEGVEGVGSTETLEIIASSEMSEYVCHYHAIAQVGGIEVVG